MDNIHIFGSPLLVFWSCLSVWGRGAGSILETVPPEETAACSTHSLQGDFTFQRQVQTRLNHRFCFQPLNSSFLPDFSMPIPSLEVLHFLTEKFLLATRLFFPCNKCYFTYSCITGRSAQKARVKLCGDLQGRPRSFGRGWALHPCSPCLVKFRSGVTGAESA